MRPALRRRSGVALAALGLAAAALAALAASSGAARPAAAAAAPPAQAEPAATTDLSTGEAASAPPAGASAEGPEAAPPAPARRVVSLNPSLTAIAVALGARDALVGVDSFSLRAEPAVAGLPAVGGLYSPSLEAVVALAPDLVVFVPTAEQRDFQRTLETLGLPVLPLDPLAFEDVLGTIDSLGARLGRATEARARIGAIRAARARVEARAATRPRPRAILVLQRDPLYVVGRGSFVDEMLASAGAENAAREFAEPYPRVAREWLLAAAPDLLLDASEAAGAEDAARYWARWPSLPAVRAGRVVALAPGVATLPGPWLDRALDLLADAVQGGPEASGPDGHRRPALRAAAPTACSPPVLPRRRARRRDARRCAAVFPTGRTP